MDGDGVLDIVSALTDTLTTFGEGGPVVVPDPGAVSVHYGGSRRTETVSQKQLGDTYVDYGDGATWSGSFGSALLCADLNQDGFSDVLVGNPEEGRGNSGEVWVLWGSQEGIAASRATKLLMGASADARTGTGLAFVPEPSPILVVEDNTARTGALNLYPVRPDGTLGPQQVMTGLSVMNGSDIYSLSASRDLLVIGAVGATVNGKDSGAADIVRFLPDGRRVMATVSQAMAVVGTAEDGDDFGFSVSVFAGLVAIGVPGKHNVAGAVQPYEVTGSGEELDVKTLPSSPPEAPGSFRPAPTSRSAQESRCSDPARTLTASWSTPGSSPPLERRQSCRSLPARRAGLSCSLERRGD